MTQRELARRAGVAQSVISAYESAHRQPSLPTLLALIRASDHEVTFTLQRADPDRRLLAGALGARIATHRQTIRAIAASHGAANLRVFGSVARGDESADSDVDLLVDLPRTVGLFALLRLKAELEALLDARVDVIPADSLRPAVRPQVEADLVAL